MFMMRMPVAVANVAANRKPTMRPLLTYGAHGYGNNVAYGDGRDKTVGR